MNLNHGGVSRGYDSQSGEEDNGGYFVDDDGGGVFIVDEDWVEKYAEHDEKTMPRNSENDDNSCCLGSNNSDNSGAGSGAGFFVDDDFGGVVLVDQDWDENNEEGDGDAFFWQKILIDSDADIPCNFYVEYGKANSFSVRRGRGLKSRKMMEEYQKEFMFSREGARDDRGKKKEDRVREPKALTRCGCLARFHIHINKVTGHWYCICFDDDHNHKRLGTVHCRMLPRHKRMSDSDVSQMNTMIKVGIRPPHIFSTFASQSGGYEKIGFRKKYMYNKINEQRRISTVFVAVVIANETKETYVWFLEQFSKAMRGKRLDAVITDGDIAMKNSIERVFPNSYHRLCAWHLTRNATSIIRSTTFTKDFEKCMFGYFDVGTFRKMWDEMVSTYGLEENTWRCLTHMRFKEKEDDFVSIHGDPVMQTEVESLEWSAAKVYIRRMESRGLVCEYILVVPMHLGINDLPEPLVLKRWTKGAKDGMESLLGDDSHCWDAQCSARKASLMGYYNDVSDFKARIIEQYNAERERLLQEKTEYMAKEATEQGEGASCSNVGGTCLRNPVQAATKGSGGASSSTGIRVKKKQVCSICKLPGHNKVRCPIRGENTQMR
ncbi:MULE transposase domain [Sesbania bispinosa]|nr:MULE transposase domain [Sesbania bispinosa]